MRRREFISLVGGAVLARPLSVLAQELGRIYRLAIVTSTARDEPPTQAFLDELRVQGFVEGKNLEFVSDGFRFNNEQAAAEGGDDQGRTRGRSVSRLTWLRSAAAARSINWTERLLVPKPCQNGVPFRAPFGPRSCCKTLGDRGFWHFQFVPKRCQIGPVLRLFSPLAGLRKVNNYGAFWLPLWLELPWGIRRETPISPGLLGAKKADRAKSVPRSARSRCYAIVSCRPAVCVCRLRRFRNPRIPETDTPFNSRAICSGLLPSAFICRMRSWCLPSLRAPGGPLRHPIRMMK